MTTHALEIIPIEKLHEHPDNPRKNFDEAHLEDLAANIREHGILTPLLVRANGGSSFQVIGGHRRYRAAMRAGLTELPAIVRHLDDATALELLVLDNLQRDNLHPLEEAAGYASLMKDAGYDVDKIAERISKSTKYVYDRVKLLQLIPELREIFEAGEITAGHAILLARLSSTVQAKCVGDEHLYSSGLFQREDAREVGLDLDLDDERTPRKAVTVRELQAWIDKHVRLVPEEVDLPNLFPDVAAALATAQEEELKVVKITFEHQLHPDTRAEGERTYSRDSWKRADGQVDHDDYLAHGKPSKTCEHAVMGIAVAGRGRGQSFKVCTAKKKCTVHWKAEQEAANERGAPNGAGTKAGAAAARNTSEDKWEKQRRERAAREAAWKKATPEILKALAAHLDETPTKKLLDVMLESILAGMTPKSKLVKRGTSIDDGLLYGAFVVLADLVEDTWSGPEEGPKALKAIGLDVKALLVEEKPKPEAKKVGRKPAGSSAVDRIKKKAKA